MTISSKKDEVNKRSFSDAYGVLQRHAETLRDQSEPNIDDLLTIVTESVQAYQVCKERIDAVEAALKAALDGAGMAATVASGAAATEKSSDAPANSASRTARQPPPAAEGNLGLDDDIPF